MKTIHVQNNCTGSDIIYLSITTKWYKKLIERNLFEASQIEAATIMYEHEEPVGVREVRLGTPLHVCRQPSTPTSEKKLITLDKNGLDSSSMNKLLKNFNGKNSGKIRKNSLVSNQNWKIIF